MNLWLILCVTGGIVCEAASQYFFTKAVYEHLPLFNSFVLLGVLSTIVAAFMYYAIIRQGWKMAKANIIWEGMVTFVVALIGYLRFQQKLTFRQIMGIISILVGMALIS